MRKKIIINTIRFAALLSAVSLLAMLVGWMSIELTTASIDVIMLGVWITKELELRESA